MSVTYKPKTKKRRNTHGFQKRMSTAAGQKIVKRRRAKGRAKITV